MSDEIKVEITETQPIIVNIIESLPVTVNFALTGKDEIFVGDDLPTEEIPQEVVVVNKEIYIKGGE